MSNDTEKNGNAHPYDDDGTREVAVVDTSLAAARSRVELDQQVATARAYPRSIKRFVAQCMNMATLDEQVAEECFYALPRDGKVIKGPSTRLSEIVASAWGNCRAGARVVDEGPEFITAQGVFQDLENNVHVTMEVRRRITDKRGRRYSADMIGVTGNAACSIALRNAVFRGVPKALWNKVYEAAMGVAIGNTQTLTEKRTKAFEHFQKLGASREQILAMLGVDGEEDVNLDHVATLKGLATAIKDGETTVDQAFAPPPEKKTDAKPQKGVAGLEQRIAKAAPEESATAKAEPDHEREAIASDGGAS